MLFEGVAHLYPTHSKCISPDSQCPILNVKKFTHILYTALWFPQSGWIGKAGSVDLLFSLHLPRNEGRSAPRPLGGHQDLTKIKKTAASQSLVPFKYSRFPIWIGSTRCGLSILDLCPMSVAGKRWAWGILSWTATVSTLNHRCLAFLGGSLLQNSRVEPCQIRLQS